MPELPEVETVRQGLLEKVERKIITDVILSGKRLRNEFQDDFRSRLIGAVFSKLSRRSKYLLFETNRDDIFVSHLGMSGSFRYLPRLNNEPPKKHDHITILFETGESLVYNDPRRFGMAFIEKANAIDDHSAFKNLGPEPLSNDFDVAYFRDVLKAKNVPIKTALLDQRVVCGLGNIYVNEALFEGGVHPETISADLSPSQMKKLVSIIKDILEKAIKSGGSSLRDHKQVDGKLGYFQHNFKVYGRAKQECGGCVCDITQTGGVQMIRQAGRSSFYCAKFQKKKMK